MQAAFQLRMSHRRGVSREETWEGSHHHQEGTVVANRCLPKVRGCRSTSCQAGGAPLQESTPPTPLLSLATSFAPSLKRSHLARCARSWQASGVRMVRYSGRMGALIVRPPTTWGCMVLILTLVAALEPAGRPNSTSLPKDLVTAYSTGAGCRLPAYRPPRLGDACA